jgi:dTDP-4-amino-4,6-dideoxygalactose transaminase
MKIPMNDLRRQTAAIRADLNIAAARVFERGWYLMGEETLNFEHGFANYLGVGHCIAMANGTDSLELALRCLDIDVGDRVIVTPNAGMYGSVALLHAGAEPLFADVDGSLCMSTESLDYVASTAHAKAVIVTHLYGQMADMDAVLKIATRRGLRVIEDCAQAHGARANGRAAGNFGDIGCFSFYPTKNLGALGDAGAIVTNDANLAEKARILRQYGWKAGKYRIEIPNGRNSRMDELQAAFLLAKLRYVDRWNARRKSIWEQYRIAVGDHLVGAAGESFVAHLCVMVSPERDALRQRLAARGIATEVHYPIPDHRQPVWQERFAPLSLPRAELACDQVLTLPCFPEMTEEETAYVVAALRELL